GKVTLTYWGLWEDKNVMSGVISDFERTHPNITVDYIQQDPKQYTDRLLTRINNGTGPDIFRFHNSWVTPLSSVLLPLPQSVLDKSTLQSEYPPVVAQDLVKNGALLGLPLEVDTLSLIVNKDIFTHAGAKVPTSWDDFVTVSKALTVKDPSGKIKTAGAAMGTYSNIDHAPDIVSLLLLQNGANLQKLDKSQNTVDALSFYTSFASGTDNVWDSTLDDSLTAFQRGNLAMYFGYSWDVLAIKAASPNLNIAVYDVPHLAGRNMTVASYWAEGISSKTTHPKEAAEFLQYLAQKDTSAKLYSDEAKVRSFGEIYARQDLAQSLTTNPVLAPFVDQAKNAASSFFIDQTGYDQFNGTLNTYLGNAVASILSNTSIDTATTTLAQGVTQVFNRYVPQTQ
ncbi:MAG TPA: sugar ABC transporter substrate-binding protein, partial [Candidatus Saccharimonadales bacterium]|nr:sugar ABC transporter substrate-binding protein [Candidatus Saccharimonadales bacterium]